MTDFDDLPHDGDTDDAADARWFRNAVAPVVDARPVADAWEDIRARATGEAPTVVHLDRSPRTAPAGGRRRLALAAAAVLAVAAIGTGIAVTRDGGDDDQRLTVAPEDTATGWYVPEELPDGWELESVETDWLDVEGTIEACPCDQAVWISPDGHQSVGAMSAAADKFMLDDAMDGQSEVESVVLDGGIDAHAGKSGPYQVVSWVEGDRGWQVASLTIGREALIAAAGRVAADPTVPPVDSYRALTMSIPALDGVRAYHSVRVLLRHPERGISVGYQLEPYPDTMLTLLAGAVEELDPVTTDQPLHKVMIEAANGAPGSSGLVQRVRWYLGQWPGAAISAGLEDSRLATGPVTGDDIEAILRTLRPATGDEWQTFLDTAAGPVDDDARTDRLSDLIVADGESGPASNGAGFTTEPSATAETAPAVDDTEPGEDQHATVHTTTPDLATTAAMDVAQRFTTFAAQVADGGAAVPDGMFSPSVALGLGAEVIRTVGEPNLSSADAWLLDEDDVEGYAGYTPPFSAVAVLAEADARSRDLAVTPGGADGCAGPTPTAPTLGEGSALVTIWPMELEQDTCINWFAVTLLIDSTSERIAGVYLYLWEP